MRWPLLVVLVLIPVFLSLSHWQWQKGERKAQAQALRDARGADAPIEMPTALLEAGSESTVELQFRPVILRGRYLPERQFLVDNQTHREQAGYHVVTPFQLAHSKTVVLVNRGWIPGGQTHDEIREITTPDYDLTLRGTAVLPPSRFFRLSRTGVTPDWVQSKLPIWQGLDLTAFSTLSKLPTQSLVVQLDPAAAGGFVRDWPRPDARIERHYAYALQWLGFALATLAIWVFHLFRKPSQ